MGKILSQEHLKATGKNCVGAACVGIVHTGHRLCPQYDAQAQKTDEGCMGGRGGRNIFSFLQMRRHII